MATLQFKKHFFIQNILLIGYACGFSLTTCCQPIENSRILIYNKVPLQIECGIFLNGASPYSPTKNDTVKIIDSAIKVSIPGNSDMGSRAIIQSGISTKIILKETACKIFLNGALIKQIQHIALKNSINPFLIIDTTLNVGDIVQLIFTDNKNILSNIVIKRQDASPKLIGYVPIQKQATALYYAKELTLLKAKKIPEFVKFTGQQIEVLPQNDLLLFFENLVDKDSSIYFSLSNSHQQNNSKNLWKLSGHTLLVDSLKRNATFNIFAKYGNGGSIVSYQIKTAPYWYQTTTFILFILLFIIGTFIFIKYRRLQKRIEIEKNNSLLAAYKLKAIQAQIDPHFIFNTLSSFQWFINNNQNEKARTYLNSFFQLLRKTLSHADEILIPLQEEIGMIESFLKIQQLRYSYHYKINICKKLDTSIVEIPPFLMQPAIENAIKHGVAGMGEIGNLEINMDFKNCNCNGLK